MLQVEKGWKLGDDFQPLRSKYGNEKCEYDGVKFDSKHEMSDYISLRDKEFQGLIFDLVPNRNKKKRRFPLKGLNGNTICTYVPDFCYREGSPDGPLIVQDSKGMLTDVYKIKKKLMFDNYGITIKET